MKSLVILPLLLAACGGPEPVVTPPDSGYQDAGPACQYGETRSCQFPNGCAAEQGCVTPFGEPAHWSECHEIPDCQTNSCGCTPLWDPYEVDGGCFVIPGHQDAGCYDFDGGNP